MLPWKALHLMSAYTQWAEKTARTATCDAYCGHAEPEPNRRAVSIQAVCTSRSVAAAKCSDFQPERSSLRRLLLADCPYLAGSALCSLSGHTELESLDLSCSIQALSNTSIAALQKFDGASLQPFCCHTQALHVMQRLVVSRGLVESLRRLELSGKSVESKK